MKKILLVLTLAAVSATVLQAQDRDDRWKHNSHDNRGEAEKITHGPVIEEVGREHATIAWSTNTGGSSVIRYGTNPNQLTQTAESPYVRENYKPGGETHRVHINHLQPGTRYFFFVDSGQGQGTGTEAHSQIMEFTTQR